MSPGVLYMGRLDTEVSGLAPGATHSAERGEAIIVEASDAVGGYLNIPGGTMLLTAEFDRSGPDLVITGKDGSVVVVRDYFSSADAPDLATAGGAVLPDGLVVRLAGSVAPGQMAQAGPVAGAERIGEVAEVQGNVRIVRANGTVVERAEAGTEIFADDLIETQGGGSVGLLFIDDTSFSLGANARMVVDELVFDPAGASTASFNVVQGAFSFISGEIASAGPNAMTVTTPVATIGIRGTGAYFEVEPKSVYFCLCYGEAVVSGRNMPDKVVKTTHHETPLMLTEGAGALRADPGGFKNHTDAELVMLEALVGREPPFTKGGQYPANKY